MFNANGEKMSDNEKSSKISKFDLYFSYMNGPSTKRSDYLDWPDYFMAIAFLSAQRSKDPRTQVIFIGVFVFVKVNRFSVIEK